MSLPSGWRINQYMDAVIAVPNIYAGIAKQSWFEFTHARPITNGGRQSAWFVEGDFGAAVLRYYRRGGLRAKLGRESYFWLGQGRVRAFAEIKVLDYLYKQQLAVPEPIGAVYWRHGLWYKNAILTRRIEGASNLAEIYKQLDPLLVFNAINGMHKAGVWHADLNANNILVDHSNRVWLIDFDRARLYKSLSLAQVNNNYQRLKRSLIKLAGDSGLSWWNKLNQQRK